MCGGGSNDRIGSQLHHKQEVAVWQETLLLRWPSCEFSTSFLYFLCQMWSLIGARQCGDIIVFDIRLLHCIRHPCLHHSSPCEPCRPWALIEIVSKSCWSSRNPLLRPTSRQMTLKKLLTKITSCVFSHTPAHFHQRAFYIFPPLSSTGHFIPHSRADKLGTDLFLLT